MVEDFYKGRLKNKFNIEVLVPNVDDRQIVHEVIFNELCHGILNDTSRKEYIRIINNLKNDGAEGVILGCTEIPLLIQQEHSPIPVFDTTLIHARTVVDFALSVISQ
jgi:aspartate racemase